MQKVSILLFYRITPHFYWKIFITLSMIFQKSQPFIKRRRVGGGVKLCGQTLSLSIVELGWVGLAGAITKLKKSGGWTINRLWLNNSLTINGATLRISYRNIDVRRRTFSNFQGSFEPHIIFLTLNNNLQKNKGVLNCDM